MLIIFISPYGPQINYTATFRVGFPLAFESKEGDSFYQVTESQDCTCNNTTESSRYKSQYFTMKTQTSL